MIMKQIVVLRERKCDAGNEVYVTFEDGKPDQLLVLDHFDMSEISKALALTGVIKCASDVCGERLLLVTRGDEREFRAAPDESVTRTVPADNFMGTVAANVDNERMTDKEFRQFIRQTLPIVQYEAAENETRTDRQNFGA